MKRLSCWPATLGKMDISMIEAIGNIAHWLSLVVPAGIVAAMTLWVFRTWLSRSVWHYGGALLIGLLAIGALFAAVSLGVEAGITSQIEQCRAQIEHVGCGEHQYLIAYPVVIGLLSFGFYLVSTLMIGLYRLVWGRRRMVY